MSYYQGVVLLNIVFKWFPQIPIYLWKLFENYTFYEFMCD